MKRPTPAPLGGTCIQRAKTIIGDSDLPKSSTVKAALDDWVWGLRSAPEVQSVCEKAYEDERSRLKHLGLSSDFAHKDLKAFASLESYGKWPNNIKIEL